MLVSVTNFHLPKDGSTESEYEDAFSDSDHVRHRGPSAFRCAVADGASETVFAREWARLLAKAFCRGRFDKIPSQDVQKVQRVWHRALSGRHLPWYIAAKAEKGAYAAFLGFTIIEAEDSEAEGTWEALALGDTCLFHIRNGELILAVPLETASAFTDRPHLLSTNSEALEEESQHVCVSSGKWSREDDFYLATDAFAEWLLTEQENGRAPWRALSDLGTEAQQESFEELISRLRGERTIRNDDVTLVRIDL